MAWRPHNYLLEGRLDNSRLGKVTGWLKFAGLVDRVTFDLHGNFHRDIRGTAIQLKGTSEAPVNDAERYMKGLALRQTGEVGDITAGLPPQDYVDYPYIEWYSAENGRVVLELEHSQVNVIGQPVPVIESDPIDRRSEDQKLRQFMVSMVSELRPTSDTCSTSATPSSDPRFTHWVVVDRAIVGEAHSVEANGAEMVFAYVRLFSMPEMAEFGYVPTSQLTAKQSPSR